MILPEHLAHVQNPKRKCDNCGKKFLARSVNQKYCPKCRPLMKKETDASYYATKGKLRRQRKRRAERAKRDHTGRRCSTLGCLNQVFGTARKKYCDECLQERRLKRRSAADSGGENSSP